MWLHLLAALTTVDTWPLSGPMYSFPSIKNGDRVLDSDGAGLLAPRPHRVVFRVGTRQPTHPANTNGWRLNTCLALCEAEGSNVSSNACLHGSSILVAGLSFRCVQAELQKHKTWESERRQSAVKRLEQPWERDLEISANMMSTGPSYPTTTSSIIAASLTS